MIQDQSTALRMSQHSVSFRLTEHTGCWRSQRGPQPLLCPRVSPGVTCQSSRADTTALALDWKSHPAWNWETRQISCCLLFRLSYPRQSLSKMSREIPRSGTIHCKFRGEKGFACWLRELPPFPGKGLTQSPG